jgi:hypothetical protein
MAHAAKHSGTCQVCGSKQKLPRGVLALHGYTTALGFFSGTCRGSGHLPLEQSCDLAKQAVSWTEARIAQLEAQVRCLTAPPTEARAWVQITKYVGRKTIKSAAKVEIEVDGNGRPFYVTCGDRPMRTSAFQLGMPSASALEMAAHLNRQHANVVTREIGMAAAYLADLRRMIAAWQPRPLIAA